MMIQRQLDHEERQEEQRIRREEERMRWEHERLRSEQQNNMMQMMMLGFMGQNNMRSNSSNVPSGVRCGPHKAC